MGVFNIETQMFLLNGVNVVASYAVNWLLQSTLLISIGLIVGAILRYRGSAVQSLVYRTTLIAVLVCPLATVALGAAGFSGWSLTMPETWALETRDRSLAVDVNSDVTPELTHKELARELPIQLELIAFETAELQMPVSAAELPQTSMLAESSESPIEVLEASSETVEVPEVEAALPVTSSIFRIRTFGVLASLAALIWCLVALVQIFRLASAWWKLWLLKSSATKVEPELHLACEQLAVRMKVAVPEVYRSPFLPSPCLAGFQNPSILLPESDCGLSMQDVLIHELAHLRRHDCHWNLLRQVATSVFFFQPLLWILSRKLEITAEEVCDDFVVQFGGDRADYANRLVDLAALSSAPIAAAGVGVVSFRSMLTQRVTRILDTSRTLSTRVGNLILAIVLAGGLLGTCMTGMLGLNPAAVSEPAAVADNGDADDEANDKTTTGAHFKGQVVDPDGHPAADAKIYLVIYSQTSGLLTPNAQPVTVTDENGGFDFICDQSLAEHPNFKYGSIAAAKDGFGMAWCPSFVFDVDDRSREDYRKRIAKSPRAFQQRMEANLDRVGKPLQLVRDDEAVTGKLLNIEGQPVAGAKLTLLRVFTGEDETLEHWNAAAAEPQADFYSARQKTPRSINGPQVRSLVTPALSDAEGNFKVSGLGNGRIAQLLVEGSDIASEKIYVRTEKGEKVVLAHEQNSPYLGDLTYYPNNFTFIATPTAKIWGAVLDAKTGKPIAGATIKSQSRHGEAISGWGQDFVRTITDEEGRYSLTGMPIGKDNRIAVVPPDGEVAYMATSRETPLTSPNSPLKLDIELHSGVWLEGRVTDKQSGEGLHGFVDYHVIASNPNYKVAGRMNVDQREARMTDADGNFRFAIFPGPAYVTFLANGNQSYARSKHITLKDGSLEEVVKDMYDASPSSMLPSNSNAIVEIDAAAEVVQKVAIQLDGSGRLMGRAVDSNGNQVDGFSYCGRLESFSDAWNSSRNGKLELLRYDEADGRKIYLLSQDRKVAGYMRLEGKQDSEFVVKLQPSGSVKGRLLDEDGQPIANCELTNWRSPVSAPKRKSNTSAIDSPPLPRNRSHSRAAYHATDADGRFEIEGLVAGLEYRILARRAKDVMTPPDVFRLFESTFKVEPGESSDLGDVKLLSKKSTKEFTKGAGKANSDKNKIGSYSGFVKSPEGEPIIGAKIWLAVTSYEYNSEKNKENREGLLRELATADEQGRFEVLLDAATVQEIRKRRHFARPQLVAMAQGRGLDWLPLEVFQDDPARSASRDLLQTRIDKALGEGRFISRTLKLRPESQPVRGRLVDLEGAPLPKVTVAIDSLRQPDVARLINGFEKSWKQEINEAFDATLLGIGGLARSELQRLIPPVKTNENGEFELSGIGDDQLATLIFNGDRIEARPVFVFGREMKTVNLPHDDAFPEGTKDTFVGRKFTYATGPSIPVEGIVTDFDTGAPVANVLVYVERLFQNGNGQLRLDSCHMRAVTDGQGRFRITGMPPGEGHVIEVVPPKSEPHLMTTKAVSPNLQEGEVNHVEIQLKRGLWIEGRITDKQTGAPLSARVDYMVLERNPLAGDKLVRDSPWLHHRYHTDSDGRYRIPGLPGPGVLLVKSQVSNYPLAAGAEKIDGYSASSGKVPTVPFALQGPQLSQWHLLSQIDPAVGAVSVRRDLMLDSGRSIPGRVIGPDNKPISDLFVLGQTEKDRYFRPQPADNVPTTDRFTVNGYDGKGPRQLFFKNKAETLVGKYRLEGDAPKEIVVTAQRSVRVMGRLNKQKDDLPAAHYFVACEKCLLPGDKVSPVDFSIHWCHTDDDGRFDIKGLMAGSLYKMEAFDRSIAKDIHFTIDLTDAKPGDVIQIDNISDGDGKSSVDTLGQRSETKEPNTSKLVRTVASPQKTTQAKSESATADVAAPEKSVADTTSLQVAIALPDGGVAEETHVALAGASRDYSKSLLLGNAITGKDGTCTLTYKGLSEIAEESLQLIARKDGAAVGWMKLNLFDLESDDSFEFSLKEQGIINGRLVDIDGQPASGETLQVQGVMNPKAKLGSRGAGAGLRTPTNKLAGTTPQAWVQPVTTDNDGKFQLKGIPKNLGTFLKLVDSKRFAPQQIALNTEMSEQRGSRDGTYRPLVKNFKPGEEVVLTLSPAKIITGKITYEDTNEPVANAKVSIWSSQEEYGSMISVQGRTDEEGKYRILPNPGIRFGVSAYPPQGVAYMGRKAEELKWENSDTNRNVDIQLPRVTLVKGLVIEEGTGLPVSDATITFESSGKSLPKNAITGWEAQQKTDNDGKFTYAVPPSRGTLVVRKKDSNYVLQTMESRMMTEGKPGGNRFYANAFHWITVEEGTDSIDAEIEVIPGKTVRGVMVDEEGKLIKEAIILTRLKSWNLAGGWRGDTPPTLGGKFELTGLEPGESYKVHFLDAKRKLGATIDLKATDEEVKVVLQPCGSATAKFIVEDEDDREKMTAIQSPALYFRLRPGVTKFDFKAMRLGKLAADEDFNVNIDRVNYGGAINGHGPKLDDELRVTYPALIPGATYRMETSFASGMLDDYIGYKEFTVEPGQLLDLGEFKPKF